MEVIFNIEVQYKWNPQVGDIIVGCTGNVFVIGGMDVLHESIGGGSCNRNGGNVLDGTYC